MSKTKLIIFDFDGTIVDSEPLYDNAKERQNHELGIIMSAEEHLSYVGVGTRECMVLLKERHSLTQSVDFLTAQLSNYYMEVARSQTYVFPKIKEFILALHQTGNYKMAVASGTGLENLKELIELTDLSKYFDGIFSSEEVAKGKPAPDLFNHTADKFGILAKNCLVLEDSIPGVAAAMAANMRCISVPMEEQFNAPFFHENCLYTFKSSYNFDTETVLKALKEDLI